MTGLVDFDRINAAALANAETVIRGLCPDGVRQGSEWVFRPPWRESTGFGSCKVSIASGCWSDFKNGVGGGDLISLAAQCCGLSQREAAIRLANSLGISAFK